MKQLCFYCGKDVEDYSWKLKTVEIGEDGERGTVWICGKHFKGSYPEFVPERIKEDRRKHFGELVQPYRDGKLSKEYVDTYPNKAKKMAKDGEIKKAKDVWKDLPGHSGWRSRNPEK